MLKELAHFFFFLLLLSPLVSFAAEQETLPPGTLTVQKYTEFLCATAATDSYSLYNEKMGGDLLSPCIIREGEPASYSYQAIPEHADDPAPYVSRLSAKRYCNWLQNGKREGEQDETTTERGAYTLEGMMDEDPEREEGATYFLPASTNNEVDPTLASNLKTYVITTHLGDSFRFSNSSSQDETAAWTVGEVIAGVAGLAAVLSCRGGMHGEESSDDHYVDSADRTAQARREEESHEINAEQRRDNDSSELDEGGDLSIARPAAPPEPWANSTKATINSDYLQWLVNKYNSKRSLIEQLLSLPQDQRKEIDEQNPEIDSVLSKITEHALQIEKYFHLMRAKLSSPNGSLHDGSANGALQAWLANYERGIYSQYLNFYNSRTPEEFQTTCFSRWFQDPEDSREQAYQAFITQLTKENEIGPQYWPYKRLLQEWKNQATTAPWALPLEQETKLRALIDRFPAWKRPTQIPVQRQSRPISFKGTVDIHGDVVKTGFLSNKLSRFSPTERLRPNDKRNDLWGSNTKKILRDLSAQWSEDNPGNSFYATIHRKFLSPKTPITWSSQEEWHQWDQEFKASSALVQEAIQKKTDLLNDWENWREESYVSLSPNQAKSQRAADIWKAQIEATLNELNDLLKTAQKIQQGEHQISSALPIKQTFEILFKTTFSHLHRISTHIEDAPSTILEPLFVKESEIKTFLDTWHDHLDQNLHGLKFVPFHYQMQVKAVIAATQTLDNLVDQHQDQALRLRQIVEEERQAQQRAAATPKLDRTSLGSTDTGDTDREETTPVHDNIEQKAPFTSSSIKSLPKLRFPKIVEENPNGTRPSALVHNPSTSLL